MDVDDAGPGVDGELIDRVERAYAADCVATAQALPPALDRHVSAIAGGWLVLMGADMYVNRLVGAGHRGLTATELDVIEEHFADHGLVPELQLSDWTPESTLELVRERDYRADWCRDIYALSLPADRAPRPPSEITFDQVDDTTFGEWQTIHTREFAIGEDAATAAEQFCRAAHLAPGATDVIARVNGESLAVASVSMRDQVAWLGGMTTVPRARRRGLQTALLGHRLGLAVENGCDLAITAADPDSPSGRNIERAGFSRIGSWRGFTRAAAPPTT